jgi:hypothetical protein
MKRIYATTLALLSATACSAGQSGEGDLNAVRNQKSQNKILTVVSLAPVYEERKQPEIVASCGYEFDLTSSDETLVDPLNKYAYDNRFNDFNFKSKGFGGMFILYSGVALGNLVAGGAAASVAASGIFPPAGLLLGALVMVGSAVGAGGVIYHGAEDMMKNLAADEAFIRVAAGNKAIVNQFSYEEYKKSITEASNSKRLCPTMKVSALKKLNRL